MAENCCKFVGEFFNLTTFTFGSQGCFISVSNNINTEYADYDCNEMLGGYTLGTLTLIAYAGTDIFKGCPGRAGVQILWLRKYNCGSDKLQFIFAGQGRSYMSGNASEYASLNRTFDKKTKMISASSQSGPFALFSEIEQTEGLGMNYTKGPIQFDTSTSVGCTLPNMGVGTSPYYLQSFYIDLVPGSIPLANYSFAYIP